MALSQLSRSEQARPPAGVRRPGKGARWGAAGHGKGSVCRFISKDGEEALPSLTEQAMYSSAKRQPGRSLWLQFAHQREELSHQDLGGNAGPRSQRGPHPGQLAEGLQKAPQWGNSREGLRHHVPAPSSSQNSVPWPVLSAVHSPEALSAGWPKAHCFPGAQSPSPLPQPWKYLFQVNLLV